MDRREILAGDLENQATWRIIKAKEYPDDRRNERSANALNDQAKQVRNLPADHDGLRLLDEAWQPWGRGFDDGMAPGGERARAFISQTGFHSHDRWDVEDWLTEYTNAVREDAAETAAETAREEAGADE